MMKLSGLVATAIAISGPALAQDAKDVAHYAIGATVSPEHETIAVEALILLAPVSAGEEIEFYIGNTYRISAAEAGPVGTVTIEPQGRSQIIKVAFPQAQSTPHIRLRYGGKLRPTGDLPINMITKDLIELNLDSAWLPIRRDLNMRFTVDASIDGIPRDATVVAQGEVTRDGDRVHIRRAVRDLDFAFAAAPMQRTSGPGFELYAPDLRSERAQLLTKHSAQAIPYLQRWLGKMPGDVARVVLVRRPRPSGYARKGYIVFTEGSPATEARVARFAAHEFAHLWFSNANAQTSDRWLDESTAEYVSLRYVEESLGVEAMESLLAPKRESAKGAKPVMGTSRTDAELYDKGPVLLFELEEKIGRETIDRLIAEVAKRKIGRTSDFLAVLAKLTDFRTASEFELKLNS